MVLIAVAVFVVYGSRNERSNVTQNALLSSQSTLATNPLDQVSSADIAVHLASMARLDELQAVITNADSINAQLGIVASDEKVVAKPQIVATALKSRKDIIKYVAVDGDTVSSIASKFNVTSDTIRWSNGLRGETVAAGTEVWVLPGVNGIVYEVKQGDTVDSLATRYRASKDQIVAYNDAELSGLPVGERVIIPDGSLPQPATTAASVFSSFAWGGYTPIYAGNGYDYGYCTWWAAIRRAQVGKPIPSNLGNASTWKTLAQRAGLGVGNVPAQHAVIWFPPTNYYGHVGFVEQVFADGSIEISEMNAAGGWGRTSTRIIPANQVGIYSYIY